MKFRKPLWFDSLCSTNSYLKELLEDNPSTEDGTVVAARSQAAGKGRYDRAWMDFPDRNLTFSFLVKTEGQISELPSLPLIAALAVAEVLKKLGVDPKLKWPNDILVNGKKICGILSEFVHCSENSTAAIVGIGLNVNMDTSSAEKIDRPATSVFIETDEENDLEHILELLLNRLSVWMDKWKRGGFAAVRDEWIGMCDLIGTNICIETADGKRQEGIFQELGQNGQIILRTTDNQLKEIWAGDVFPVQ